MNGQAPYMRESFVKEVDLIAFADSFNLMDASLFAGNAATKGIDAISRGIDSLTLVIDSAGIRNYNVERISHLKRDLSAGRKDSAAIVKHVAKSTVDRMASRKSDTAICPSVSGCKYVTSKPSCSSRLSICKTAWCSKAVETICFFPCRCPRRAAESSA